MRMNPLNVWWARVLWSPALAAIPGVLVLAVMFAIASRARASFQEAAPTATQPAAEQPPPKTVSSEEEKVSAAAVVADLDPRFDAETGRNRAHYPISPQFDFKHMKLVIELPNIEVAMFSAVETLTVEPIGVARATLRLDAGPGIDVESVRVKGRTVRTRRDAGTLWIDFATPMKPGESADVVIRYVCDFKANKGVGLTWSKAKPDGAGPTQQNVQLHSQGQAEENRGWFLMHDSPNEKLTTELVVTLEESFEVCSNGYLVAKRPAESDRSRGPVCMVEGKPVVPKPGVGMTTHHWLQDKPHASYLVTLVVGKLGIVDINPKETWSSSAIAAKTGSVRPGLPMHVWTPMGTEEAVKSIFANTPWMVSFYEARFAQPYPWDKYDQLICRDFRWGGMENTSATTLYSQASRGKRGDHDELVSHELAHQWFGDLVTCKSWEHLWLNEGWASIAEALWAEQEANLRELLPQVSAQDGKISADSSGRDELPYFVGIAPPTEAGRRAYQKTILRFMRSQRGQNRAYLPQYPAMASKFYTGADEPIAKADDVYAKGALVLHMLRTNLGDDNFFKGTALYLDRMKFKCAETDDFRHALEEVCGRSLERFFDQWVKRPGLPRLEVDLDVARNDSNNENELTITVEQSQRIDGHNPAYVFTLPVLLKFEDGTHRYVRMDIDRKSVTAKFTVPSTPSQVSIDPNLTVLAGTTVRKPLAMWINEMQAGPTLAAQVRAAEAILESDSETARNSIREMVLDERTDATLRTCLIGLTEAQDARVLAESNR